MPILPIDPLHRPLAGCSLAIPVPTGLPRWLHLFLLVLILVYFLYKELLTHTNY